MSEPGNDTGNDTGNDEALTFDHLGSFEVGDRMVVCDSSYLGPQFQGMRRTDGAPRSLQLELPVEPGVWHALVGETPDGDPAVLLLCHGRELELDDVFERAEVRGVLQVDGRRLVAGHAGLRDDPELLTVLPTLPADQFPGIVLDAGAAVDGLESGAYVVHTSVDQPSTVVFLALSPG